LGFDDDRAVCLDSKRKTLTPALSHTRREPVGEVAVVGACGRGGNTCVILAVLTHDCSW